MFLIKSQESKLTVSVPQLGNIFVPGIFRNSKCFRQNILVVSAPRDSRWCDRKPLRLSIPDESNTITFCTQNCLQAIWCASHESNLGQHEYQSSALPTELHAHNENKTIIPRVSVYLLTGAVHLSHSEYRTLKVLRLGPYPTSLHQLSYTRIF